MDERRELRLHCPCGELVRGYTEDEIVERATRHLQAVHPDRAADYTREDILAITL